MSVNKVILLGNLGKDPELKYTPTQTAVCTFSIATSERRKDQAGNWTDKTEWHNIVSYGKTAENSHKFLKKGRQVFIDGKIQTRKWQDKEGKDRYMTEIIANTIQFIGGKDRDGSGAGYTSSDSTGGDFGSTEAFSSLKSADSIGSNGGGAPTDISFDDDDIPF